VLSAPVVLHDERLSTVEAERALRDAGATGRDRRQVVDRSAATVILQAYLDVARGSGLTGE
jgi:putative holliday junction resolvase